MFAARNGNVQINGIDMHYNVFGSGREDMVMIPGLSDGLRTVKGLARTMAMTYREFGRRYRVWIFSRREKLAQGMTTRDMARELAEAMELVGIKQARVLGLSQGGMIGQWLAIDYPEKVSKLVIAVSLSRQNPVFQSVIREWIDLARSERYGDLAESSIEKTYTEKRLRRYRPFMFLIRLAGKPRSQERFIIQAQAVGTHDAYAQLGQIQCPTLVIGGAQDLVVGGPEVQEEMAEAIPESRLHIYPGLGHGAYEEAKDFNQRMLSFFAD